MHVGGEPRDAPDDVRFHLSRGAAESFVHTVPLLHPRGYLQVQDIFVADMHEYRQGFRGPGKLDGSVVNWVNGALLRAIGVADVDTLHDPAGIEGRAFDLAILAAS